MISVKAKYLTCFGLINIILLVSSGYFVRESTKYS
jgi:hypothetical protein